MYRFVFFNVPLRFCAFRCIKTAVQVSDTTVQITKKNKKTNNNKNESCSSWRNRADALTKHDKIIANPNCSTIQMVVALNSLHKKYTIKRIVVSTYQSVTGTGKKRLIN
jgi:aspartate-semialdehyde dehydrogenase